MFVGYPALRGPICYSCNQQKDPAHCGKIDVCKDGQVCKLSYILSIMFF
jgi:hypothetical protein